MCKFLRYSLTFVILLHFLGISQLVSIYSKNTSALIGALSMNEDEGKKENDDQQDKDLYKDVRSKITSVVSPVTFNSKQIYLVSTKNRIGHQFIIELPTPPPDFKG